MASLNEKKEGPKRCSEENKVRETNDDAANKVRVLQFALRQVHKALRCQLVESSNVQKMMGDRAEKLPAFKEFEQSGVSQSSNCLLLNTLISIERPE